MQNSSNHPELPNLVYDPIRKIYVAKNESQTLHLNQPNILPQSRTSSSKLNQQGIPKEHQINNSAMKDAFFNSRHITNKKQIQEYKAQKKEKFSIQYQSPIYNTPNIILSQIVKRNMNKFDKNMQDEIEKNSTFCNRERVLNKSMFLGSLAYYTLVKRFQWWKLTNRMPLMIRASYLLFFAFNWNMAGYMQTRSYVEPVVTRDIKTLQTLLIEAINHPQSIL